MKINNVTVVALCTLAVFMVWWNIFRPDTSPENAHRRVPIAYRCQFCSADWTVTADRRNAYFEKIKKKHNGDIPLEEMMLPCPSCKKPHAGIVQGTESHP